MVYANPSGFDFGPENWDGYGISMIVFTLIFTTLLFSACFFLFMYRNHPVVKMRNVPLMLSSVIVLHVFFGMSFVVYTLNGRWPCQVEFWCMNLYFPIGIGLFQAQNQQLLIVSQGQAQLAAQDKFYKPIPAPRGQGVGSVRYWIFRLKFWWNRIGKHERYLALVYVGIVVQFIVSFIIYNISRKFNHYGVVDHHVGPGLCRRGWEWVPSMIWQFLYNYFFGPYLLWKIRMIRDIYHWRLQTMLVVIAGLPGTPLWLAAVYSSSFAPVNKYFLPAYWFWPGLFTMEVSTVAFPLYQIYKHARTARETNLALAAFDQKAARAKSYDGSTLTAGGSLAEKSIGSKGSRGRMYTMEALDECLAGDSHEALQLYASCMEFNGENIIFLTRVRNFTQACARTFGNTCKDSVEFRAARKQMFKDALNIFITLVHSRTATYPINIESPIYTQLEAIFGRATAIVATKQVSRVSIASSTTTGNSAAVTPWDEPGDMANSKNGHASSEEDITSSYPMQEMSHRKGKTHTGNESSEHIVRVTEDDDTHDAAEAGSKSRRPPLDPTDRITVPADFDENVFEPAWQSIRYMVWTETWQRYCAWRKETAIGRAV